MDLADLRDALAHLDEGSLPELIPLLPVDRIETAVRLARRIADPRTAAVSLAALAQRGDDPALRTEAIERARGAGERAPEILAAIAGLLTGDDRRRVVEEALDGARASRDAGVREGVLFDAAAAAPPDLLGDVWDLAARSRDPWAVERVLAVLGSRGRELPAHLRERLVTRARARRDPRRRLLCMASIARLLTPAERTDVLSSGLALVLASDDGAPEVVQALAGGWGHEERLALVTRALEAGGDVERGIRDALVRHLDAADATRALRAAAALRDADRRPAWLVALAPRLPDHFQVDAVEHVVQLRGKGARRDALAEILPVLSSSAARQVLGGAARREAADDWAQALASWPGADAGVVLPAALRVARLVADPAERLVALANLSRFARPPLRDELLAGILADAAPLRPAERLRVLETIASQLGTAQRIGAIDLLPGAGDGDERRFLIASLTAGLPDRAFASVLRGPVARTDPDSWTWAIRQRHVSTGTAARAALDLARRMRDPAGRAATLAHIAGSLPVDVRAGVAADALALAGGAGDGGDLGGVIELVAPYLPDDARAGAADLALGIDDDYERGHAAAALLPYATGRAGKRLERAVAHVPPEDEEEAGGGGAPEGLAAALQALSPRVRARLLDAGLEALARPREATRRPSFGGIAEMGATELPEMAEMGAFELPEMAELGGAAGDMSEMAEMGAIAEMAEMGATAKLGEEAAPGPPGMGVPAELGAPAGRGHSARAKPPPRAMPPERDFPGADGEGRAGDATPVSSGGPIALPELVEPILEPPGPAFAGPGAPAGGGSPHRARAGHVPRSKRAVSTGFADPADPGRPLPPDEPLPAGSRLLYWLEIGEPVAGAIDALVTDLPAVLAGRPVEIEVVLFSPDAAFQVEGGPGLIVLAESGSVVRIRQPTGEVLDGRASRRMLIPLVSPARPGRYVLRCNLYVRRVLVQSRLITAAVSARKAAAVAGAAAGAAALAAGGPDAPHRASRPIAVRSVVDYSISNELGPAVFAGLSEHRLSLMLNDGPDGRSSFYYAAGAGGSTVTGAAAFDGQLIQSLIEETRAGLRWASWNDGGEWQGQPARYDGTRDLARLREDLIGLARRGYDMWDEIVPQLSGGDPDAFADATRRPGLIQVSHKTSPRLLFPAALVYDYPLDTGLGSDHTKLCPTFEAGIDAPGELGALACFNGTCPSYGADDVVCPGGFWGYRHALGFPVAGLTADDGPAGAPAGAGPGDEPAWSNLPTEIDVPSDLRFLAAISTDPAFQPWAPHEQRLRAIAPGMTWTLASDRDQAIDRMRDAGSHVVYFYCHGGSDEHKPFLRVGPPDGPMILASTLSLRTRRVHWTAPRPLVFLNGCHTTALEPEEAHPLVEAFVGRAEAAGVIGTEVTIFEGLARPFAEECLRRFLGGTPLGAAVRDARLALLKQGTPLGLAYIPYALADLHVRKAAG